MFQNRPVDRIKEQQTQRDVELYPEADRQTDERMDRQTDPSYNNVTGSCTLCNFSGNGNLGTNHGT